MMWANDFYEILDALSNNLDLKECVKQLIIEKELVGKALEGGNRKQVYRKIMIDLVDRLIDLQESYYRVERQISENTSMYSGNKRVFSNGWGQRLVRTYLSKFYNQAVLLQILESGEIKCFIPHSKYEDLGSDCTSIAGRNHDARVLLERLVDAYELGRFSKDIKIPNHPHCTHVVKPLE